MSDQCRHCTVRGDIVACKSTDCSQHDSWMVKELEAENKRLREGVRVPRELIEVYDYHLKQTETSIDPGLATIVSVLYGILDKMGYFTKQETPKESN